MQWIKGCTLKDHINKDVQCLFWFSVNLLIGDKLNQFKSALMALHFSQWHNRGYWMILWKMIEKINMRLIKVNFYFVMDATK